MLRVISGVAHKKLQNVWRRDDSAGQGRIIRMRLWRTLAQRHEFRAHGHAAGDFHADDRFERLELA